MRFGDLVTRMRSLHFPSVDERHRPSRENVRAVQHGVAAGLGNGAFLVDCIELELASIVDRPGRSDLEPFFVDPFTGARFAFAYWAPGRAAGAHEHNDWTVTAVCHNRLDVETYDFDAARSERVLRPKNLHHAERGQAGHIYDPCIHNPCNPTRRWSMSIHIISPHDGPVLEKEVGRVQGLSTSLADDSDPGDPLSCLIRGTRRQRTYRILVEVLSSYRSSRALRLIEDIYARGDLETRRIAAWALSVLDPSRGNGWMREVAAREIGRDTALVRGWPSLDLSVRRNGSRAELFTERKGRASVLLRLDHWAERTLEFAARAAAFQVGDLPGELSEVERSAVARALVDLGLFHVAPSGAFEEAAAAARER